MRRLGRCGRQRRVHSKDKECRGVSKAHLAQYVTLQRWMRGKISNAAQQYKMKESCYYLKPTDFKETGRGLQTTRNIHSGETVVSIPLQLMITTTTVLQSDIGLLLQREEQQLTPQQLLTVFLVIERCHGNLSPWFPYINTLPDVYCTTLYFSHQEIKLLAAPAKTSAQLSRQRFNRAFERIKSFVHCYAPSYQHMINESDVRWAWSTVNTRSVYFQTEPHPSLILDPEESNVAMAPFLDLLNHRDTAQMSAGMNSSCECYEIVTQDSYKENSQVFICYGAHDNVKLLVDYGFTLCQNLNNSYAFTLADLISCIKDLTQHIDRKISIIREAQLHKNLVCTAEGVSWSLMTALKIAALTWEQMPSWKILLQGGSVSKDNDEGATQMATRLVTSALHKARRHLKFVEMQPQSTHLDMIRNLAQDDVTILETSLTNLQHR